MPDLRCSNCSLAISASQQVILARFTMPTRIQGYDIKPQDGDRPEVFHAGCLPLGWLLIEGPISPATALARLP